MNPHHPKPPGFTLIELLVVVTIIVVLLALLVPAMDKAIYQAELAVCAANQGAVAKSAIAYASGAKRYYPYRDGARNAPRWHAAWIYNGNPVLNANNSTTTIYDERPVLREFISLNNMLNDPLSGGLDFDRLDLDCHAYSNYAILFGFRYQDRQGLVKLGDRLTAPTHRAHTFLGDVRHEILVGDRDVAQRVSGRTQTAHADDAGVTSHVVCQNQSFDLQATGTGADSLKLTISTWSSLAPRGQVDLNFGFLDGSVRRFVRVERFDGEMRNIPDLTSGPPDWFMTVPPTGG